MPKASDKNNDITVEQFEELRDRAERLRSEANKAEGVLEQLKNQLREEFGCSEEDGERELVKRKKELEKSKAAVRRKLEAYQEKWGVE